MRIINLLLILGFLIVGVGCAFQRQQPGWSMFQSPSGFAGGVRQSENPKEASKQVFHRTVENGKITETLETEIGAAQKDTIAEAAAKLKAMRPVMFVGIFLFVAGAASLVYPPLKLIVGSATTSAVAMVAGLALTILPTVIVGNELLILGVGVGAVALYWFSHRHGSARTEAKILREKM